MRLKMSLRFILLIAAILSLCGSALSQEVKPAIENLSWLSGCWEMNVKDKNLLVSEQWMKPAGQSMMGIARTVKNGKTVEFEFLRIAQDDLGISYIARPSDNKEDTAFKLVRSDAAEVIFENLAHDFPQRIIYRLEKPDSLSARVEAKVDGKIKGIDFPMIRAKCE